MTYKLYCLQFESVHFGNGTLDSSSYYFTAERLFSALVLEALKSDRLESWMKLAQSDDFVMTDAFPYKEGLFLPKPIGYPTFDKYDQTKDVVTLRKEAKKQKKLDYIPSKEYSKFLNGQTIESSKHSVQETITKNQPQLDGGLFQVGVSTSTGNGDSKSNLCIIATQSELFDDLMTSLQYSGLGGKRSSGYGRFVLKIRDIPKEVEDKLTLEYAGPVMALTTCLPLDDELEGAMLDAKYLLKKSSGFAFSQVVTENLRKQDSYKFVVGSTFTKTFKGQIIDVRPDQFPHPVWAYAKPLFYKLEE